MRSGTRTRTVVWVQGLIHVLCLGSEISTVVWVQRLVLGTGISTKYRD